MGLRCTVFKKSCRIVQAILIGYGPLGDKNDCSKSDEWGVGVGDVVLSGLVRNIRAGNI